MNINPYIEANQRYYTQPQYDGERTVYHVIDRTTGRKAEGTGDYAAIADAAVEAGRLNAQGVKK